MRIQETLKIVRKKYYNPRTDKGFEWCGFYVKIKTTGGGG